MLAVGCPQSCIAVHTVNPDVPPPRFAHFPIAWLKYRLAKLTLTILGSSSYGYTQEDMAFGGLSLQSPGLTPPMTPGGQQTLIERPQTVAYALCDSPPGLLAYMLDAIRPPHLGSLSPGHQWQQPSPASSSTWSARSSSSSPLLIARQTLGSKHLIDCDPAHASSPEIPWYSSSAKSWPKSHAVYCLLSKH